MEQMRRRGITYGISKRELRSDLRPTKYPRPEPGWRHVVHITGGVPEDCWLSLSDTYLVVGGALAHGGTLLVDPGVGAPLTLELAFQHCALLSFIDDSGIVPQQWSRAPKQLRSANSRAYDAALKGVVTGSLQRYLEKLAELSDVTVDLFGGPPFGYELDFPWEGHVDLPAEPRTWRALTAYWSGLLSLTFPGRILNFWRSMEAVTEKEERYRLFANLQVSAVQPLWLRRRFTTTGRKRIDAMRYLRRNALHHHARMVAMHGSAADALDTLYFQRRGRAAHADKSSLEFDHLLDMGEQARDAQLLQYMARVAIQQQWR